MIIDRVLSSLKPHALLIHPDGSQVIHKGSLPSLHITVEHRQGGKKHVTRVAGLETYR